MGKYRLGSFEFDTREEYDAALKEVKYLAQIRKHYEINNPETAKKVLNMLQDNNINLHTKVGVAFIKLLKMNASLDGESQEVNSGASTKSAKSVNKHKSKKVSHKALVGIAISVASIIIGVLAIKGISGSGGVGLFKILSSSGLFNSVDFKYQKYDDGYYITGLDIKNDDNYDNITIITFPSTYKGHDIVGITGNYSDFENLESVTIKNGIKYIGDNVFNFCSSLKQVDIPNSVIYLGGKAFSGTSIRSIRIPEGVTKIQQATFAGCSDLSNVSISEGVTNIDRLAFAACKSLSTIILPNSLENIDDSAFQECTGLTTITIPENVDYVGRGAFAKCTNLSKIVFESAVTEIFSYRTADIFIQCNNDDITIYAPSNSTAEAYANDRGMKFVSISSGSVVNDKSDKKDTTEQNENAENNSDTDIDKKRVNESNADINENYVTNDLIESYKFDITKNIDTSNFSISGYNMVYINNDDIPELILFGSSESDGNIICTYIDRKFYYIPLSRSYFYCIPKQNIINNLGGSQGHYYDAIYNIAEYGFDISWYGEWESNYDDDGIIVNEFRIGEGDVVTIDEYAQEVDRYYGNPNTVVSTALKNYSSIQEAYNGLMNNINIDYESNIYFNSWEEFSEDLLLQ